MATTIANVTGTFGGGYSGQPSSQGEEHDQSRGAISSILVSSLLTVVVIIAIIIGNTLLCIAVATDRSLKGVQHRFLVSLAVADLMVGVLIMPLGLVNQVLGYWVFGIFLCNIWTAIDVLACTASIWNLCLIAIDRYYSITQAVRYTAWRNSRRVNLMIMSVWTLSTSISIPPLIGWKADGPLTGRFKCLISEDVWYILFSTSGSFYIPAIIMIIVYLKVWRAASYRARSNSSPPDLSPKTKTQDGHDVGPKSPTLVVKTKLNPQSTNIHYSVSCDGNMNGEGVNNTPQTNNLGTNVLVLGRTRVSVKSDALEQSKRKLAHKREMRATLILGIIMGTFLACWYPFFQLYVISALCGEVCNIPTLLFDVIFWIGYCNSALNPVIYTVFNRDFRRAFSKIIRRLFRRCSGRTLK